MAATRETDPAEKAVEAAMLLDIYGDLLTERQQRFTRLHFEEDLSFSEIARDFGISRQAVHDSVKHAVEALNRLEATLGLAEKALDRDEAGVGHVGGRQLIERLTALRARAAAEGAPDGPQWLVEELDALIALLRGGTAPAEAPVAAERN